MTDACCCPPEAGNAVCDRSAETLQRPRRATNVCPVCGMKGKPVQGQTVKTLLSVSLRAVQAVEYLFCKSRTCPVVYFSLNGEQTFTTAQIRERVYQKEPTSGDVLVCYCFRHSAGDIRTASPAAHTAIIDDINTGISAGQCACDLRNPQGACCLGNVRVLIKEIGA
ncbi:MAG: hypothetical protein IT328_23575 [Caldilineaceae bacterium]|nr:hypothetical protein [Caldilineaceae bacterium]